MMIPLSLAQEGEKLKVLKVLGRSGFVKRLIDMGIRPGMEIEVVSTSKTGPIVIRFEGLRLGIGFGMTKNIFVEPPR
ncbi:MAG: FeoA family protein [Thermodesulfobacteriota bacterium]|nr:FeoA family protein [Thermodesulfobacteriota bacterium]